MLATLKDMCSGLYFILPVPKFPSWHTISIPCLDCLHNSSLYSRIWYFNDFSRNGCQLLSVFTVNYSTYFTWLLTCHHINVSKISNLSRGQNFCMNMPTHKRTSTIDIIWVFCIISKKISNDQQWSISNDHKPFLNWSKIFYLWFSSTTHCLCVQFLKHQYWCFQNFTRCVVE